MRKAALIYNPVCGGEHKRRLVQLESAAAALRERGLEVLVVATHGPRTAGEQARQATAEGCELIFACGGDGTVNEVLQGIAATGNQAALAVIPLGTGNVLAENLRIPRDPVRAVLAALAFSPQRIPAGKIEYRERAGGELLSRYFTVMAGVGVDAQLPYKLTAKIKRRYGMAAYYASLAKLAATTRRFPFFQAECHQADGQIRRERVSQVVAMRVPAVGVLKQIAPWASLHHRDLPLMLFKSRNPLRLVQYAIATLLPGPGRVAPRVAGMELIRAVSVSCSLLHEAGENVSCSRIYAQSDGEFLGSLPVRISVVTDAFTLLMPPAPANH